MLPANRTCAAAHGAGKTGLAAGINWTGKEWDAQEDAPIRVSIVFRYSFMQLFSFEKRFSAENFFRSCKRRISAGFEHECQLNEAP